MQSLFYAVSIYGLIATWISYRRKRENMSRDSQYGCIWLWLLSRGFVWLQLKHLGIAAWCPGLMDTGIFLLLVWMSEKPGGKLTKEQIWLYVTNPVVILSLTTEKKMLAVALLLCLILLVKRLKGAQWWEKHAIALYRYYFYFSVCGVLYLRARMLFDQHGIQCITEDENYPWAWFFAAVVFLATLFSFVRCVAGWKHGSEEKVMYPVTERRAVPAEGFGGRDILWMVLLTALYAAVVFFRLGSREAPQSYRSFSSESEETDHMNFLFAEETAVSEIRIYLGEKGNRSVSLAYYDKSIDNWYVFEEETEITSVFTWNKIPVKRMAEGIRLEVKNKEADIYEIVILDKGGNMVLPVNWEEYEELFDEQELYPQYPTYYEGTMFDEVYYARTAYHFIHGLSPYELSHPPLGKLIISLGVRVCGMTPFGWRVAGAIFGTAMVPLLYLFAHRIFKQRRTAVFSTVLFCFEFMHLTLSRIATLDIIVAFFVLGMFYYMYLAISGLRREGGTAVQTRHLFLCGGFSACAISVKWTGFYALAGIAVLFLSYVFCEYGSSIEKLRKNRKLLTALCIRCVAAFVILPVCVYLLSYLPYTWCGYTENVITIAVENFSYMLKFHQGAMKEHIYSSEWYEWLWVKQPLVDAFTSLEKGKVSSVVTMGNPLIWWGGAVAFVHNVYLWRCKQEKVAAYLCIAYLSMLLPWLFIYRTVFIYQYFICSNLLVLLLGNSFCHMGKQKGKAMIGFAALAGILFICFYPVLTGYPVAAEYVNRGLEWFESWIMA